MADKLCVINEDHVICSICLDKWINNDPRHLSCQHIHCFGCLKNLPVQNNTIICPICSRKTNIENGQVENLPKSYIGANIYRLAKSKNICETHRESGILYCKDHNIANLCLVCLDKEHSKCNLHSMDEENRKQKHLKILLEKQKELEVKMILEITKKKEEIIEKIENEIENLTSQIRNDFDERKNYVKKCINKEVLIKDENSVIEFLENQQPELFFGESIITSGFKYLKKYIQQIEKTHSQESNLTINNNEDDQDDNDNDNKIENKDNVVDDKDGINYYYKMFYNNDDNDYNDSDYLDEAYDYH